MSGAEDGHFTVEESCHSVKIRTHLQVADVVITCNALHDDAAEMSRLGSPFVINQHTSTQSQQDL